MAKRRSDVVAVFEERKQRILDLAKTLKGLAAEREDAEAVNVLSDFVERFQQNRFLLLIVGDFKSGKSTLVNALVGRPVCPVKATPRTAKVTRLTATEADGVERVDIHFIEDRPSERVQLGEVPLDELVAVGGSRSNDVQMVDVFIRPGDTLLRHPVRLVDTPGLGSSNEEHSKITRDYMQHTDALVVVFSASKPFSDSERDFLLTFRQLLDRAVFVVNQIDRVSDDERDEVLGHIRHGLKEDVLGADAADPVLLPVASRRALDLLKEGANYDDEALIKTGLPAIVDAIEHHLAQAHATKLLKNIAEQQQQVTAALVHQAMLATEGLEAAGPLAHGFRSRKKKLLSELDRMASRRDYAMPLQKDQQSLLDAVHPAAETLRNALNQKVENWITACASEEACKKSLAAIFAKELTGMLEDLDHQLATQYRRIGTTAYKNIHILFRDMETATRQVITSDHAQSSTNDDSLARGAAGLSSLSAFANSMGGPTGGYGIVASALSQALAPSAGLQFLSIATVVTTLLAGFAGPVGWVVAGITGLLTAIFGFSRSSSWRERVISSVRTKVEEEVIPSLNQAMQQSIHAFAQGLITELDSRVHTVRQRLGAVVEEVSREIDREERRRKEEIARLKAFRQRVEAVQESLKAFTSSLQES
ncbi:dynamin family protein [Hyalangium rubrum]|uniref:Dynamin family protein n=1 Tax=Hyalangium rubrum TaxID=3103134 RepID=A0ABU5H3Z1_9BACT|nr:dynamin family protein [Hyalangium sp. s54d21]MDY7226810.1 dynamin family protein [Hyalangium sp. s54d21]